MWHWCDVSMILSGDCLLILEYVVLAENVLLLTNHSVSALQKLVPFSYRTRERKPGILVKYAKVKAALEGSDQLAPFEGLWGFDSGQDFYNGTIFRFPLRKEGQNSELLESRRPADVATTLDVFRKRFDEARLALLFLRNLTTIDFSVKGRVDFEWRVSRGTWPQSSSFSDWADILVEHQNPLGRIVSTTERWWRAIEDVHDAPIEFQHRHSRSMKHVECGIAALVPQNDEATKSGLDPLKSRFFNCLPLKFESTLPVHIHATFLLSGDRQNIATEETSQDAGAEWNNWLLKQKLPGVYFRFLEDIGRKIGQDVYNYFPTRSNQRSDMLSDLIRASFWQEIKSSGCRLFPIIKISQAPTVPMIKARAHREAPNLVTFECAIFDVLAKQTSSALRLLLCNCLGNLVCPPVQVTSHIKHVAGDKILSPALVRGLLKSPEARKHVERSKQIDKGFLNILLSFIMPTTTAELAELDGCPVLPLANGELGTLSLMSTDVGARKVKMYYSANAECHDLLASASSLFSAIEGYEKFVAKILNFGQFNLKNLERGDISSVLLGFKESWPQEWASETWIVRFWKYMNSTSHSNNEAAKTDVLDWDSLKQFPLLLLRHHGGQTSFMSLHHIQSQPVVMSSTVQEHMDLLAGFRGLGIIDSSTVPESIRHAEKSLFDLASLNRFLKSIRILAARDGKNLTEFVRVNVGKRNIVVSHPRFHVTKLCAEPKSKTLRNIILKVSGRPEFKPLSMLDNVHDLPLWPRVSSKEGYLTAREAIVAEESAFVVPWIRDYDRFTEANDFCKHVSIGDAKMLTEYVLPALPEHIYERTKATYTRLIRNIAYSFESRKQTKKKNSAWQSIHLSTYRLAATEDGNLCLASDLFDAGDSIFSAAFRVQPTNMFLMPEVRKHASFWYELGIRRREHGKLKARDYLACLHALQRRLTIDNNPTLATDTEIVLRPLCASDGSLSDLDYATWSTIATMDVFPVKFASGNEPEYRRVWLRESHLASQRRTMSLKEVVRREFAAVCWSQTSFALHEPSIYTLQQIGSKGQPSCAMVCRHLTSLADHAKSVDEAGLRSFVEDLNRTYDFLQLNLSESKSMFRQPQAAIWLNVEAKIPTAISIDVIKSSWTSLENLLLDSPCDAPPLMTVQPFLGRFSTLLKDIGCNSVCYPSIAPRSSSKPHATLAHVWKLWQEDILVDVRFEAEGRTLPAHKVILASHSEYCKRQFHGPWAVASGSNDSVRAIIIEDMTYATLKILIGYCYIPDLDWAIDMHATKDDNLEAIADKLDALLDVLAAADRWFMPDLHADAESNLVAGARFFIRPDNVEDVSRAVGDANSVLLKNYCEEYKARNAEAVLLAS